MLSISFLPPSRNHPRLVYFMYAPFRFRHQACSTTHRSLPGWLRHWRNTRQCCWRYVTLAEHMADGIGNSLSLLLWLYTNFPGRPPHGYVCRGIPGYRPPHRHALDCFHGDYRQYFGMGNSGRPQRSSYQLVILVEYGCLAGSRIPDNRPRKSSSNDPFRHWPQPSHAPLAIPSKIRYTLPVICSLRPLRSRKRAAGVGGFIPPPRAMRET